MFHRCSSTSDYCDRSTSTGSSRRVRTVVWWWLLLPCKTKGKDVCQVSTGVPPEQEQTQISDHDTVLPKIPRRVPRLSVVSNPQALQDLCQWEFQTCVSCSWTRFPVIDSRKSLDDEVLMMTTNLKKICLVHNIARYCKRL